MFLKIKQLSYASKIIWILNVVLTFFFIAPKDINPYLYIPILLFSGLIQYVLTLIESALFDGDIPLFWKIDYEDHPQALWLFIGSIICLLLDIVINLGGVSQILHVIESSSSSLALKESFGISDVFLGFIHHLFVFLFSILIATGSELINSYIHLLQDKPKIKEKKSSKDSEFNRNLLDIKR